jgi:hypothetical protein
MVSLYVEIYVQNLSFLLLMATGFVSAQIAVCYIYLLVFTWVYLGDNMYIDIPAFSFKRQILYPFKSLRWVMTAYLVVAIILFIVAIIGAAIMSLAIFCEATAPGLYKYSLFLVTLDWVGMFITVVYLIKTSFGGQIAQFIVDKTKEDTVSDVEVRIFKKKFDDIDTEETGKISRENGQKLLQNLGIFIPEEEIGQLMDTLDPTQSGEIQYETFLQWFQALSAEADEAEPAARRGGQEGPSAEDYYSDDD